MNFVSTAWLPILGPMSRGQPYLPDIHYLIFITNNCKEAQWL